METMDLVTFDEIYESLAGPILDALTGGGSRGEAALEKLTTMAEICRREHFKRASNRISRDKKTRSTAQAFFQLVEYIGDPTSHRDMEKTC